MSHIVMDGERKEAVLVRKADIIGHDLTILEEERLQLPYNEQIHNVKKYTCLDNTDQRVVSFFGSSIMDNQELRYTDHLSIEKKISKAGKQYYIWKLEI